jgi:hypothetical protein
LSRTACEPSCTMDLGCEVCFHCLYHTKVLHVCEGICRACLTGASQVLSIECNEGVRSPSPLNGERAGVRGGNHPAPWSCRTLGLTTPQSLSPLRGEGRRTGTALNSALRHYRRVETEMRPCLTFDALRVEMSVAALARTLCVRADREASLGEIIIMLTRLWSTKLRPVGDKRVSPTAGVIKRAMLLNSDCRRSYAGEAGWRRFIVANAGG